MSDAAAAAASSSSSSAFPGEVIITHPGENRLPLERVSLITVIARFAGTTHKRSAELALGVCTSWFDAICNYSDDLWKRHVETENLRKGDTISRSAWRAVTMGLLQLVKIIVLHKPVLQTRDAQRWTPLHHACYRGQLSSFRVLNTFADLDTNVETRIKWTPLRCCVYAPNEAVGVEMAKALLARPGTQVDVCAEDGWTALHAAAYEGRMALCELLIKSGNANINAAVSSTNKTPIFIAIEGRKLEVVRLLLSLSTSKGDSQQVRLDVQSSKDGRTPLIAAVASGNTDIVRLLLEDPVRACATAADSAGKTAYDMASRSGSQQLKALFEAKNISR